LRELDGLPRKMDNRKAPVVQPDLGHLLMALLHSLSLLLHVDFTEDVPTQTKLTVGKALQEIRYYQKRSDQLIIPKSQFRRLCLEIGHDFVRYLVGERQWPSSTYQHIAPAGSFSARFTQEALIALQMAAEKYITDYLHMAYLSC
jgi:histone H3/H4